LCNFAAIAEKQEVINAVIARPLPGNIQNNRRTGFFFLFKILSMLAKLQSTKAAWYN
jgi:hypothetical protein